MDSETAKRLAFAAGFDLCGVTTPEVIKPAVERFGQWLDMGYHGEMAWLAGSRDRRADPRKVLDAVRSIIVLGFNYYQPNSLEVPWEHGRVSRYARGKDYHNVIAQRLKHLVYKLREGIRSSEKHGFHSYVDHGAVLERAYALKAGLGFSGKNALLINRKFGSWVFLAEILTSLELEADRPDPDSHGRCGDCRLCVEACPTEAIVPGGMVDARKCISYLTIERPREIPAMAARQMDSLIFGCDICQEVCPYNSRAVVTGCAELERTRGVGEFLDARRVIALQSRDEFLKLTAGTSLTRPGLENIQRSARIVLANQSRP